MPKQDPRIDAYIIKSADFALPILQQLRVLVHAACPETEETMKWSFPHFMYKGEILCSMASFKQHCAFGFWKAALMKDAQQLLDNRKEAMGTLGKITSLKDLPADKKVMAWVKEAMKLNDAGIKVAKAKPLTSKELVIPAFFSAALAKNKKALAVFEKFSPSQKREYTAWLIEAKTVPTREKRMSIALEWIAAGKIRNWKYMN
ncbi:MAG: DUF1801 domain-containing protein [Chitinophagaceae bacterium]